MSYKETAQVLVKIRDKYIQNPNERKAINESIFALSKMSEYDKLKSKSNPVRMERKEISDDLDQGAGIIRCGMMIYTCPKCKSMIPYGKFCYNCGQALQTRNE